MVQDPNRAPHHLRKKCLNCGLVNADVDDVCRRCGTPLTVVNDFPPVPADSPVVATRKRGLLKRIIWICGATLVALIIWYVSLLISSDGLQPEQRARVQNAIAMLRDTGFNREAFLLEHLTTFRSTDNWWNTYVGHRDAYAATNFPFEIVTLYPDFFEVPVDDKERAAVLLHESRHLMGDGEDAALESAWRSKQQLGWTADKYRQTRVWNATEQLTKTRFPYMFQCGSDGHSDCF